MNLDNRSYDEVIVMVRGAQFEDLNGIDLSDKSLQRIEFPNVTITRTNFNRSSMVQANMPNSQLVECTFNYTNFAGAILKNTLFISSELIGTIFTNVAMNNAQFEECTITGISAYGLFGNECIFNRCTLTDTPFLSVHLIDSQFLECAYIRGSFEGSDLFQIIIQSTEFTGTKFSHCGFDDSRISNSKFTDCTFVNCTFTNVSFETCTFEKCIFISCDFTNALFQNTNLDQTQFSDAIFVGTRLINTNTTSAQVLPTVGPVISFDEYFTDIYTKRANDLDTPEEITFAIANGYISNAAGEARMQTLRVSTELQCDNDTDYISGEPWTETFVPDLRIRYLAATPTERDTVLCMTADDLRQWVTLDGHEFRAWYPNHMRQRSGQSVDPDGRGGLPSNVEVYWQMPIFNQLVVNPPVDILRLIDAAIAAGAEIIAYPIITEKGYGTPIQPYFVQSGVHGQPSHARTVYMLTLGDPLQSISSYVGYMYDIRGIIPPLVTMQSYYSQAEAVKNIVPLADAPPQPQPQQLQPDSNTLIVYVNRETGMIDLEGTDSLLQRTIILNTPNSNMDGIQQDNIVLLVTIDGIQEILQVPEGVRVEFSNVPLDQAVTS